jgi:hypothetical protein
MVDIRTDSDLLVAKVNGKIESFFIQAIYKGVIPTTTLKAKDPLKKIFCVESDMAWGTECKIFLWKGYKLICCAN